MWLNSILQLFSLSAATEVDNAIEGYEYYSYEFARPHIFGTKLSLTLCCIQQPHIQLIIILHDLIDLESPTPDSDRKEVGIYKEKRKEASGLDAASTA